MLKIGHHGSRMRPGIIEASARNPFVSAGRGNLFGHPAPDVLGVTSGWADGLSDRSGRAIVIETDGREAIER
jgi:beta-lactamase superfamily II metal-dependent hydrolase